MITTAHLDLNVVEHCNLSCRSCSHASPVLSPWFMSLEEIERDLTALTPFIKPRSIHVVGGEPLLHKQLPKILRLIKKIRLDEGTTVITNGRLLPRMTDAFWSALEYLQISVYEGFDLEIMHLVTQKQAEFGFGYGKTHFDSFYRQLKAEPDDGLKSFTDCHWKSDCWTVHRGHFYLCSQSCFFPNAVMGLAENMDGLPLDGLTEEKLQSFINRKEPFNACKICCANEMKNEPHRQVDRKEWEKESRL